MRRFLSTSAFVAATVFMSHAFAQASDDELAKKLANPVSNLISVPLQFNYDEKYGTDDSGHKFVLNVQPVIPFSLNSQWNVISRTIIPIVSQDDLFPGAGSQNGLGDITQSFFFTPHDLGTNGITWGIGPVLLLPTGTDSLLSGRKWGAGPTGLILKQEKGWTYGTLVNHIWSFAGTDRRSDISTTFIQPFLSYTTKDAWTYGANSEMSYDWEGKAWSVPINFTVSKLTKFGNQRVSIGGGIRYWAESPENGPNDLGFRFTLTFLFPK